MKQSKFLALLLALSLAACGDSPNLRGPMMDTGDGDGDDVPVGDGDDVPVGDGDDVPVGDGDGDLPGMPTVPDSGTPGDGDGDAAGDGDDAGTGDGDGDIEPPPPPWYACQGSDQMFVRKAIQAVLGRRPLSQAEVNMYVDLIGQIDAADGITDPVQAPGTKLRRSRRVMLQTLYKDPSYLTHWADIYRDLIRVQRVDQYAVPACHASGMNANPAAVATYVRDNAASKPSATLGAFNMYDVLQGALVNDDVSPYWPSSIFTLLSRSYDGANAQPIALELSRRADFGSWFEAAYIKRDVVCLGCHNSEFSVTQTSNPATNRHFPIPALLEKSLFGDSSGPPAMDGFDGVERARGALRYASFTLDGCQNDTANNPWKTQQAAGKVCPNAADKVLTCEGIQVCSSYRAKMETVPWGWSTSCGRYIAEDAVLPDVAGVPTRFGTVNGLKSSPWSLSESLRKGFLKLKREGLGVDPETLEVPDPDKAFAYLVAMNIAEGVWMQIVGTPLTIPTRFPRNAAARDQLLFLTNTFVQTGYSNKKLIEAVLASPFSSIAPPEEACGKAYNLPALFDPWVIADEDHAKRMNSAADGVASMTGRSTRMALYQALEWPLPFTNATTNYIFPSGSSSSSNLSAERLFQNETGFFLKNAEPGFRGFDFQSRLSWETRFATCAKDAANTAPDFVDQLAAQVTASGKATVKDLVVALKDRLLGEATIDDVLEKPALAKLLGAELDADASSLTSITGSLRKLCGVLVSTPQFMLSGLGPTDTFDIPKLTPPTASYAALCSKLEFNVPDDIAVVCKANNTMEVVAQ